MFFFTDFFVYRRTVTSASLAISYFGGPAMLSTARIVFFTFSFSASSLSLPSTFSSSDRMTTQVPSLASLWSAVACSSFLTRLVKPGVISRAKTAATGTSPSRQTGQDLVPAYGPATLTGLNGVTPSPGAGPDFTSAPKPVPATTPTTTAVNRNRDMDSSPLTCVAGPNNHRGSRSRPRSRTRPGVLRLFLRAPWIVGRVEVVDGPRPVAVELHHRLPRRPRVVLHPGRPRAERPGRHGLALHGVELVPHAQVEGAGNDGQPLRPGVGVRRDLVPVRDLHPHHERTRLGRVAFEDRELCTRRQGRRSFLPHDPVRSVDRGLHRIAPLMPAGRAGEPRN